MKYLLLFIASTSFAMEQNTNKVNYFDCVPGEVTKLILEQVGDQENPATRYDNFKSLINCKCLCKKWIPLIDTLIVALSDKEKAAVAKKSEEWTKERKYNDGEMDVINFSIALEQDNFIYMYNYFKNIKNNVNATRPYVSFNWRSYSYNPQVHKVPRPSGYEMNFNHESLPPLLKCIEVGALNTIGVLLHLGAIIESGNTVNKTALQLAIEQDKTAIAKKLIHAGAKLQTHFFNVTVDNGYQNVDTKLFDARKTAKKKNNTELVQFIDDFTKSKKSKKKFWGLLSAN